MSITKNKEFINWIVQRMKHKYKEDTIIINSLNYINENFIFVPKKISLEFVDKICSKHYPDFNLEKCDDLNFGFDESERMRLRNFVLDIISSASDIEL
jgi:hypothetical protein